MIDHWLAAWPANQGLEWLHLLDLSRNELLGLFCQLRAEAEPLVQLLLHPWKQRTTIKELKACAHSTTTSNSVWSYIVGVWGSLQGQLSPVCGLRDVSQLLVTLQLNTVVTVRQSSRSQQMWWTSHGFLTSVPIMQAVCYVRMMGGGGVWCVTFAM